MSKKEKLNRARIRKNDEYYTRIEDVERIVHRYGHHLKGKHVYCNCDSDSSAFFTYLYNNFLSLGIQKLTFTNYRGERFGVIEQPQCRHVTRYTDTCGNASCSLLNGDGDFRSEECIRILEQADVVITNPPFSLFREHIKLCIKMHKDFVLIGNLTSVKFPALFPLLNQGKLFIRTLSHNSNNSFLDPENTHKKVSVRIYTTLKPKDDHVRPFKNDQSILLHACDNHSALNVPAMRYFPVASWEVLSVPLTFIDFFDHTTHKIISTKEGLRVQGKYLFARLLVQRIS